MVIDQRQRLIARKADLLAAIETLDQDREEGSLGEADYARMRGRYETEAAQVLEELDRAAETKSAGRRPPVRLAWLIGTLAVGAAIALFLVSSLSNRSTGETITGSQPIGPSNPVSSSPSPLVKAQHLVQLHPRSYDDLLALGNAYLDAGQAASAAKAYARAARVSPALPEAPTLSALLLASQGKSTKALAVLHQVESSNPSFARAWFVDGLVSSRRVSGYSEAVASWAHFLRLSPTGSVAGEVRTFLQRLCVTHEPGITSAMRSSCTRTLKS